MGERAHYIVKSDDHWSGYYSQWGGMSMELDLLAGPEPANRFARLQRAMDEFTIDADYVGCALIDADARRLLWLSECLPGPAYRAAAREVLRRTWSGWSVDWGYGGLSELLTAIGIDPTPYRFRPFLEVPEDLPTPEAFMRAFPQMQLDPRSYPPGEPLPPEIPLGAPPVSRLLEVHEKPDEDLNDNEVTLISVADEVGIRAYALLGGADLVLCQPERLLDVLTESEPDPALPCAPGHGLHFDRASKTVRVWTEETFFLNEPTFDENWPGWRVDFRGDDREPHLAMLKGVMDVPAVDPIKGLDRLESEFTKHQKLDSCTHAAAQGMAIVDALTEGLTRSSGLTAKVVEDNMGTHRPMDLEPHEIEAVRDAIADVRADLTRPT